MSPKLKPLLLPQLVEERKRRESASGLEVDLSALQYVPSTTPSELPSPVTPTFSTRGHLRYPSSTSSVESFSHTPVLDTPSSPTFPGSKAGKRSLPDVEEEPLEKDEYVDVDADMLDYSSELYDCLCDDQECLHRSLPLEPNSMLLPGFGYDFTRGFSSDEDFTLSTRDKKKRTAESPLNGLATRLGTRFPSFSRRLRKDSSSSSFSSDVQQDGTVSRSLSSRSSSISNSIRRPDQPLDSQIPLTPTKSVFGSRESVGSTAPIDIEKANGLFHDDELEENFAATPLLPPVMMGANANQTSMQSPLQSPSVADSNDPFGNNAAPMDSISTPQLSALPSPPLSTRPSVSSFHRPSISRPGHLVPSSEIPPLVIADPGDEWANKLGHANFTVFPEPYLPNCFDLEACRQLRANWDLARCNYTKHLVRTGEHYGVTSKTYTLTEEKWAFVDTIWRKHNDITIANTVDNSNDAFLTLKHNTIGDESCDNNMMTRIPSLNDIRGSGKFPQLGDEDIVGPMVQVAAAQLARTPGKKAKLFRFFADKFPIGLGKY